MEKRHEVVPAVLSRTREDLLEKLGIIEDISKKVHIDIADGSAVPNRTLPLKEALEVKTPLYRIFHLMVRNPLDLLQKDFDLDERVEIIFHLDWEKNPHELMEWCEKKGFEVSIALSPVLEDAKGIEDLTPFLESIKNVLVMAIRPGFTGQKFEEKTLKTMHRLKKKHPDLQVAVDGGMNPQTARKVVRAGVEVVYSSSYILRAKNPAEALEELEDIE